VLTIEQIRKVAQQSGARDIGTVETDIGASRTASVFSISSPTWSGKSRTIKSAP
jgi:hypothetical protein